MNRPVLALSVLFVACLAAVVVYKKATEETQEQYAARRNVEILNDVEQAWTDFRSREPAEGEERPDPTDPKTYIPLRAALMSVSLAEAADDVKAVHARFLAFVDRIPQLLARFKPPPKLERANRTQQSMALEEWSVQIRNAGIQLEKEVEKLEDDIRALRKTYKRQMKH